MAPFEGFFAYPMLLGMMLTAKADGPPVRRL
jgi:hypothetical protein